MRINGGVLSLGWSRAVLRARIYTGLPRGVGSLWRNTAKPVLSTFRGQFWWAGVARWFLVLSIAATTHYAGRWKGAWTDFLLWGVLGLSAWGIGEAISGSERRRISTEISRHLRKFALLRLHQSPIEDTEDRRRTLALRLSRVVESLVNDVLESGALAITLLVLIVFSGVALGLTTSRELLATGILLAAGSCVLERQASRRRRVLAREHGEAFQALDRALKGSLTLRSHAMEPFLQRRFDFDETERTQRVARLSRKVGAFETLRTMLLIAVVVSWVVALLGYDRPTALVVALPLLFYSHQLGGCLARAGEFPYLTHDLGPWLGVRDRRAVQPDPVGKPKTICLEGVIFEYRGRTLGPLNMRVSMGRLDWLRGGAGSGKSAVLAALAGLRTIDHGRLLLETADAVGSARPGTLAGRVLIVEEEPYVWRGTLRENLLFGNSGRLSDLRLWLTLEKLGLSDWARRIGLDRELDPDAPYWERSEKRRIALARALLIRPDFLLIDEPFLHLSSTHSALVETVLQEYAETRAVLVAGRSVPSTLQWTFAYDLTTNRRDQRLPSSGTETATER